MGKSNFKKGRKKMFIIWGIAFVVIVLVSVCITRVVYLTSPTKGDKIAEYSNSKSALLVIDVQNDTVSMPQFSNTDVLIKNINDSIESAKNQDMNIIYVKQEYDNSIDSIFSGGKYKSGTEGAEIYKDINVVSDNIFSKHRSDTFSESDFEQYLINEQIDTLYIVGAEASACIYKTALGGVNRGYKVTILEDGIFSIREGSLDKMKEKYIEDGISVKSGF